MNLSKSFSSLRVTLVMCFVVAMCADGAVRARCAPKTYLHKAMQTDKNGRSCSGEVAIRSCYGYCVSHEVSDWQFPYKVSYHPVCVHGKRRPASAKLESCDPFVQPGTENYHFVEAVDCKCQVCSSDDTSCEWIPPESSLLGGLIVKEELKEELNSDMD